MIQIYTATVGQNFGTVAVVKRGAERLHETATVGLGADSAARLLAIDWCRRNGTMPRNPGIKSRRAYPKIKGDKREVMVCQHVDADGRTWPRGTEFVPIAGGQSPDGRYSDLRIDGRTVRFLSE